MPNNLDNFAVMIESHGRPNMPSYKSLRKQGYTGRIIVLIDNEDKTAPEYKKLYGDEVVVFDKIEMSKVVDTCDNFDDRRAVVYARNYSYILAKELGLKYFLQIDDDYNKWDYRRDEEGFYGYKMVWNLDKVFDSYINFSKNVPANMCAMAQGGDYIGGKDNGSYSVLKLHRKVMNTFFCTTSQELAWKGRMNDDVNTYLYYGIKGVLFLTTPNTSITQIETQNAAGGMTDIYLSMGTYVKSFYSVIIAPAFVKVAFMGQKHRRLHHRVSWNNAVPVILSERHKKYEN